MIEYCYIDLTGKTDKKNKSNGNGEREPDDQKMKKIKVTAFEFHWWDFFIFKLIDIEKEKVNCY